MEAEIYRRARQFREALLAADEAARAQVIRAYALAWGGIGRSLEELMRYLVESGDPVTQGQLLRLERYQQLMDQIEAELTRFGDSVQGIVSEAQRQQVTAAALQARELLATATGAPLGQVVNLLPTEALQGLVGQLQDGTPLARHIAATFPAAQERVKELLITGLAAGKGPREIARKISQALEPPTGKGQGKGPLAVALRTTRTEILRAHREATRENYAQHPGVVQGWIWLSSRGTHTCAACLAMDGTVHPISEPMGTHPNCRCTLLPWLSDDPPPTDTGEAWLERQSPKIQAEVLGRNAPDPEAARAFREGRVRLADFVEERHSDVWGTSRTARTLERALTPRK